MKSKDEILKSLISAMENSPDWGERFFKEYVPSTMKTWISSLIENSEYSLENLDVKENNDMKWVAAFSNNVQTGEKKFLYNKQRIIEGYLGADIREKWKNKDEKLVFIMNSLSMPAHEFRHYEQWKASTESFIKNINPRAIIYIKEEILQREMNSFYVHNHDSFFSEIDAEYKGSEYSKKFLERSNLISKNSIKRIFDTYEASMEKFSKQRSEYVKQGGFCEVVSSKCDAVMKYMDNEKRQKYLKQFPVLNVLYNHKGEKRTYEEIMELKEKHKTTYKNDSKAIQNIDRVYEVVIRTDKELRNKLTDFARPPMEIKPKKISTQVEEKEEKQKKQNVYFGRGR